MNMGLQLCRKPLQPLPAARKSSGAAGSGSATIEFSPGIHGRKMSQAQRSAGPQPWSSQKGTFVTRAKA